MVCASAASAAARRAVDVVECTWLARSAAGRSSTTREVAWGTLLGRCLTAALAERARRTGYAGLPPRGVAVSTSRALLLVRSAITVVTVHSLRATCVPACLGGLACRRARGVWGLVAVGTRCAVLALVIAIDILTLRTVGSVNDGRRESERGENEGADMHGGSGRLYRRRDRYRE